MSKRYISWDDIKNLSDKIADEIVKRSDDLSKVTLVAVSRGGLVPVQLIAYKLNIRDIRLIKLISYDAENKRGEINDISSDVMIDNKDVYIIDDLADSGNTIKYLRAKYTNSNMCTLLAKVCCNEKVDICAEAGLPADEWLVFPWDYE